MPPIVRRLFSISAFLICCTYGAAYAQSCGSADGIELPCWKDFLDRGEGDESLPDYPYAKRPNGCSIPYIVPGSQDNFASLGYDFSFRSACNTNDICYYTLGTSPEICNTDGSLHK